MAVLDFLRQKYKQAGNFVGNVADKTYAARTDYLQQQAARPSPVMNAVKQYFAPTPEVRTRDVVRELPGAGVKVIGGIARDIARSVPAIGGTVAQAVNPNAPDSVQATSKAGKFVFGDEPIYTMKGAIKKNAPELEKYGFNPESSKRLAGASFLLGTVGNFVGGGEGSAAKKGLEAVGKEGAEQVGKKTLVSLAKTLGSKTIKGADKEIEKKAFQEVEKSLPGLVDNYEKQFGKVVNTDNARELFPEYAADRSKSAAVHEPASYVTKQVYAKKLAENKGQGNNTVFFTAGGTGAGKSTALEVIPQVAREVDNSPIIYDANMSSFNSAVDKIEQALQNGYKVKMAYVDREPINALTEGALPRANRMGRTVPIDEHLNTHLGSRDTVKQLMDKYQDNPNVEFSLINNNNGKGNASLITDLDAYGKVSYNKSKLRKDAYEATKQAYQEGKIDDKVYEGFTGQKPKPGMAKRRQEVQSAAMGSGDGGLPQSQLPEAGSVENPQDPFYNVKRLKTKNQKMVADAVVGEAKPKIEAVVGKKLSHQEVIDYANTVAGEISKKLGRDVTLEIGAHNLQLRQKLAALADEGKVTNEFFDTLVADKATGTDLARLLGQRGIDAEPTTPAGKLMTEYVRSVMDVAKTRDEIIAAAQGVDFNDPEAAAGFYRTFVKPKLGDWLDKLRYNSMLSSPNTHINNASSNYQGTGLIAPIEKTLAGGLDWLSAPFRGGKRTKFAGEGAAYAKGYYSKLGEAAHRAADVMRGAVSDTQFDRRAIPLTKKGTLGRKVENTLDFAGKLLQASDEFFSTMVKGGAESALKLRAEKGVKIGDAGKLAADEARRRLFNSEFGLPEDGYVLKALEYIPSKVLEATQSKNPVTSMMAKFTFPFVRVPANIAKAALEYSPAGAVTLWGAADKQTQLAKAIMGTSIAVGTAALLSSDRITWAEPTNAKRKAAFRAAGMQPYSIKIGNNWYSYSKLHPAIAFNLAFAAAWKEAHDNKTLSEDELDTLGQVAAKWVNFYADQSYVKNIGDFVAAAKGDSDKATAYFSNYPQQLIPFRALMGWIERATDPVQRQADPKGTAMERQLQQIAAQIPGLAQTVPARLGPDGQPIENQNRLLNAFSPIRVTTEKPEGKAAYDLMVDVGKLNKEQKLKNDALKEAFLSGDMSALQGLTLEQQNALRRLAREEQAKSSLTSTQSVLYDMSKDDLATMVAKDPSLAADAAKVTQIKALLSSSSSRSGSTSLKTPKIKGIKLGKKGRKAKVYKPKKVAAARVKVVRPKSKLGKKPTVKSGKISLKKPKLGGKVG